MIRRLYAKARERRWRIWGLVSLVTFGWSIGSILFGYTPWPGIWLVLFAQLPASFWVCAVDYHVRQDATATHKRGGMSARTTGPRPTTPPPKPPDAATSARPDRPYWKDW